VDLVARKTEVTEPKPPLEEDLIISEAIKVVITKELNAETNSANGKTFIEAREAIMKNKALNFD
jgi:hypothetical protein